MNERGFSIFLSLDLSRLGERYGGRKHKVLVEREGKGFLRLDMFSTVF